MPRLARVVIRSTTRTKERPLTVVKPTEAALAISAPRATQGVIPGVYPPIGVIKKTLPVVWLAVAIQLTQRIRTLSCFVLID